MATRSVIFDANSLMKLLTHYSEGEIPLNSELKQLLASAMLPNWIGLVVESDQWPDTSTGKSGYGGQAPYHFRYEGKRTMRWDGQHHDVRWSDQNAIETPTHQ